MNNERHYNEAELLEIRKLLQSGDTVAAYELLVEPLHRALYEQQSFDILSEWPVADRTALAFDYIRTQVNGGGFIQLIQNGYVSLLLTAIEGFQEMQIAEPMAEVLDDTLKVYVLNVDTLSQDLSVNEFAQLYNEFGEFEELEKRFEQEQQPTLEELAGKLMSEEK